MSIVQFYFLFPALFMLHELEEIVWMPSFFKKNINPVSKQSNPILLHSFCFQCHCLGAISDPNDVAIS